MATPSILSSPSLHAHTYQPGSMSSSHHTRAHPSPSTSTVAQAAQVPLPGTPSTPSRRKRVEAEDELANGALRKKRVETGGGGAAGPAAERAGQLPGVQEEAAHKLAAVGAGLVDGKRVKQLPYEYMDASEEDLVILIASMLTKLIQHNDQVPLLPEHLTRFHSRAPPSISVVDYLHRIVKYTNIEKSPLLLLLPYLDAFCLHLPSFTLSSLTVHRFLISSACVASKALCDSFCTNAHYAKVGGIRVGELNLLERELVSGLGWKLTCEGSLLQSYYTSLISSYSTTAPPPRPNSSGVLPIQTIYVQGPQPPPRPPPPPPAYLPWPSWESFEPGGANAPSLLPVEPTKGAAEGAGDGGGASAG